MLYLDTRARHATCFAWLHIKTGNSRAACVACHRFFWYSLGEIYRKKWVVCFGYPLFVNTPFCYSQHRTERELFSLHVLYHFIQLKSELCSYACFVQEFRQWKKYFKMAINSTKITVSIKRPPTYWCGGTEFGNSKNSWFKM